MKAHKIDNLIKACKGGHSEVAMQLLERGANPEERTAKGKTALMYTGRGHDHIKVYYNGTEDAIIMTKDLKCE